jgi:tetratricopeptide (TPR) repeat protein
MSLDKLKATARQHEHREEWSAAIELYREAIRASEAGAEGADPSLYNRVGDVSHKAGLDESACDAWRQAAARYGEQGFFNNAIALCGKILRLDPSRVETYFDLARYHARKRVLYDVRQNLTLYRDQMAERGDGEEALAALHSFAKEFQSWRDIQGPLDELLGRTSESPQAPSGDAEAERMRGLVFLDTEAGRGAAQGPLTVESSHEVAFDEEPAAPSPVETDLVLETTQIVELETPEPEMSAALDGLEPTSSEPAVPEASDLPPDLVEFEANAAAMADQPSLEGLSSTEFVTPAEPIGIELEGLESTAFEAPAEEEAPPAPLEGLSSDVIELEIRLDPPAAAGPSASEAAPKAPETPAAPQDLVFLDTSASDDTSATPVEQEPPPDAGVAREDADTAMPSDDPLGDRVTASALLEHGDRAGGISALERALAGYVEQEDWTAAYRVATDLITAEPNSTARHQARVEVAAKWGDRPHLTEAYVALGEAFQRAQAPDKAVAVFRRALELDEHNAAARAALRAMAPKEESPNPEGYIDFGAMVIDDVGPRSTRMRTETAPISPDEDETFREALAEFKRALDQNLPIEDHQTHYDLGVAFREMGLLDEAIGEFQKALRSVEGRLRTAEALGQTFFEQGRPAVAEAVLKSVERGTEGDADKIGVLYWLGRALEAQGKGSEARGCYDRVLAVDVSFHDVADRVTGLSGGGDS